MPKPQQLPDTGDDHDKVLEAKLAELIGTTPKALQRKREKGIIPHGVWCLIDGRVTYSKWRYNEWVESLWTCQKESKSSATPSASASHGSIAVAKPLPMRRPPRGSPRPQVFELR
ncbi:hypothetical protein [Pseudomonas sp. ML96]|uniref:hypothetical protein n=1 Tax=Pseudomonas sp. ML96 TaxID=1523503 RepID=UPI00210A9B34|nr:hypothetical protein [Pseudomonas sp. ML96]